MIHAWQPNLLKERDWYLDPKYWRNLPFMALLSSCLVCLSFTSNFLQTLSVYYMFTLFVRSPFVRTYKILYRTGTTQSWECVHFFKSIKYKSGSEPAF